MLQVIRSPKIYDVCIVGSGAAGGAAAKVLTEGGVSVVMLVAVIHCENGMCWVDSWVPSGNGTVFARENESTGPRNSVFRDNER